MWNVLVEVKYDGVYSLFKWETKPVFQQSSLAAIALHSYDSLTLATELWSAVTNRH